MFRSDTPTDALDTLPKGNLTGSILQGNYRVDAVLRGGSRFTIYEAEHLRLARRVAVKCLVPHLVLEQAIRNRFEKSVDLLSALRHPHVLAIHDYDTTRDGRPYVVMEYLKGKTLLQHIREKTQFAVSEVIEIVTQIAGAISTAHDLGLVHGELTASNVLLLEEDQDVFVKVIGFDAEAQGKIEPAADQYSLGIILYELLSGRPMSGLPSERGLPRGLVSVIFRSLERRPSARYPSVQAFCSALREAVGVKSQAASLAAPRPSGVVSLAAGEDAAPSVHSWSRAPTRRGNAFLSPRQKWLEENLDHARREVAMGNVQRALGCIGSVIEEAEDGHGPLSESALEESVQVLRSILREKGGPENPRVESVAPPSALGKGLNLTPEDAYLLSLLEEGMSLESVPELSPMSGPETWYRLTRLVTRGLIKTNENEAPAPPAQKE